MQSRRSLTPLELTPQQVEALRQLAQFGSVDAARSLGRLLGTVVDVAAPRCIRWASIATVPGREPQRHCPARSAK